MWNYLAGGVCILFLIGVAILVKKFKQGKWLRLLAGNTFNELPKKEVEIARKRTIKILNIISGYLIVLAFYCFFQVGKSFVLFLSSLLLIGSMFLLIVSLIEWIKIGY